MRTPDNTVTRIRNGRCSFITANCKRIIIRNVEGWWRVAHGIEFVTRETPLRSRELEGLLFDLNAGALALSGRRAA